MTFTHVLGNQRQRIELIFKLQTLDQVPNVCSVSASMAFELEWKE
jgi:hypothetical protein